MKKYLILFFAFFFAMSIEAVNINLNVFHKRVYDYNKAKWSRPIACRATISITNNKIIIKDGKEIDIVDINYDEGLRNEKNKYGRRDITIYGKNIEYVCDYVCFEFHNNETVVVERANGDLSTKYIIRRAGNLLQQLLTLTHKRRK